MKRFFVGLLAVIGLLALLVVAGMAGLGWWLLRDRAPSLPETMVLTVDLRQAIREGQRAFPAGLFGSDDTGLIDLVTTLDRAARDPRVKAVFAQVDETNHGFATTQEVRAAIGRVRAAGKPTVAFADTLGELSSGNAGYYLASAFERIVIQPHGALGLTGLAIEEPFAAGLLERLGVDLQVTKRREFKTALDSFAERGPSPAHQEMMDALVGSMDAQLRQGIVDGRSGLAGRLDGLIDGGPYTVEEASEVGLIDAIGYRDEALGELGRKVEAPPVPLGAYRDAAPAPAGPRIAVVHAVGPILRGSGGFSSSVAAADDVAGALRAAREDPDVRAVIFRIASPGGSAVGSETIAREVQRLKDAAKPVIVSMGDVAGSGGYWIAADADVILADPGTLTGSIGVIAARPVLQRLWEELDIAWSTTARGENADIWTVNRPFTEAEQRKIDQGVDALYEGFKQKVATGRKLDPAEVETIAKGRVWTGEQALPIHLVDRLGGFLDALAAAREKTGLRPDDPVTLTMFPQQDFNQFVRGLGRSFTSAGTTLQGLFAGVATWTGGTSSMPVPELR